MKCTFITDGFNQNSAEKHYEKDEKTNENRTHGIREETKLCSFYDDGTIWYTMLNLKKNKIKKQVFGAACLKLLYVIE